MVAASTADDALSRAERRLIVGERAILGTAMASGGAARLVIYSFANDYAMATMASDESAAAGSAPPILRAAWEIAASAGLWWPFSGGVIFAERPSELHLDDNYLLHHADAAAAVFRDGTRVYAWHGLAVPEDWILHPEDVVLAKLRGLDPTLRQHVASKRRATVAASSTRTSAILSAAFPADAAGRLAALRAHARGSLPLFDRYMTGEHTAVWKELVARGVEVRHDPLAADALAVAYETMRRVHENVRAVVSGLVSLGYEFTTPDGRPRPTREVHVPPESRTPKRVQRLEKNAGMLPLSMRAFCEVVGAVDLIGHHPSLAPRRSDIPPDPLVVAGVDELLSEVDTGEDPETLTLAPDGLHKANTSGGDPYEIAIPDPAADAVLLNEPHELLFVEYLRLCFRFGGFPGYAGFDRVPPEIEVLRRGLLDF
jgi:hypothetical protein